MHENSRENPGGRLAEPCRSSADSRKASAGVRKAPAGSGTRLAGNFRQPVDLAEGLAGSFRRSAGIGEASTGHISRSAVHLRRLAGNYPPTIRRSCSRTAGPEPRLVAREARMRHPKAGGSKGKAARPTGNPEWKEGKPGWWPGGHVLAQCGWWKCSFQLKTNILAMK